MELIVGIVHLINTEDGLKATLVEGLVMGNERKTGNLRLYLLPHVREDGGIFCICGT